MTHRTLFLFTNLLVATFLFASGTSFSATNAGINFDDLAGGLNPPLPLPVNASPHATFSTEPGAQLLVFEGSSVVGGSNPNNLTAGFDPSAFPYDADVFIDFTEPVNELSFSVLSDNNSGEIAKVNIFTMGTFDSSVNVIGDGNFNTPIPIDLTSYTDITRLEIVEITDEFGLSYDDFGFNTPIPEPSSIMLLLVHGVAIVNWRRSFREQH